MKKSYLTMHNLQVVPPGLIPLVEAIADLATDLRWTRSHAGDALWAAIDPQLWELSENSFAVMQHLIRNWRSARQKLAE